ncbi:MAG: hypothetical protein QXX87_01105 [Candidatus Jordarchaeales archaeon]
MGKRLYGVEAAILIGEGGVKLLIAIHMGATTIEEVVRVSGLNERVAKSKFNTLKELGLVEEDEGKITLSNKGRTVLEKLLPK